MYLKTVISMVAKFEKLRKENPALFSEIVEYYYSEITDPENQEIVCSYDGEYPNLCGGYLEVKIGKKNYSCSLESGGTCGIDDTGEEQITSGAWKVNFPSDFPDKYKAQVEEWVDVNVPYGCCGGCL